MAFVDFTEIPYNSERIDIPVGVSFYEGAFTINSHILYCTDQIYNTLYVKLSPPNRFTDRNNTIISVDDIASPLKTNLRKEVLDLQTEYFFLGCEEAK